LATAKATTAKASEAESVRSRPPSATAVIDEGWSSETGGRS
jgi:hypothetical protein